MTRLQAGQPGFDFRQGKEIFSLRLDLRPTQPLIEWIPGALSPGVRWTGCEADHSFPSSAVKKEWSYTSTPPYIIMAWCLISNRDNFAFTFIYL
jgi:hypothetical protein